MSCELYNKPHLTAKTLNNMAIFYDVRNGDMVVQGSVRDPPDTVRIFIISVTNSKLRVM
jgi:hypothetical protein